MNKIDLVISSGNENKIREIKKILFGLPINILSKKDIGMEALEIEEDKETLEENALKKAKEIAKHCDKIVLADDTGLFVDKLDGEPGVYSSRYAGEDATDGDNNIKLLQALAGTPMEERTARFVTVIAVVLNKDKYKIVTGECKGRIALEVRGRGGFGYDPLFLVDGYNQTFSEMGEEEKNKISHRANALRLLRIELEDLTRNDTFEDYSD